MRLILICLFSIVLFSVNGERKTKNSFSLIKYEINDSAFYNELKKITFWEVSAKHHNSIYDFYYYPYEKTQKFNCVINLVPLQEDYSLKARGFFEINNRIFFLSTEKSTDPIPEPFKRTKIKRMFTYKSPERNKDGSIMYFIISYPTWWYEYKNGILSLYEVYV